MAHFLNAAFGSGTASYCRLGNDLEEYSPELSANVEKKNNILGQTSVTIDSYQKQGEVAPYYAEKNDPLFEKLQAIIDGDLTLDDLKTDIVEVKLWGEASANAYPAIKEECYIEIVSYGGDTTGYLQAGIRDRLGRYHPLFRAAGSHHVGDNPPQQAQPAGDQRHQNCFHPAHTSV